MSMRREGEDIVKQSTIIAWMIYYYARGYSLVCSQMSGQWVSTSEVAVVKSAQIFTISSTWLPVIWIEWKNALIMTMYIGVHIQLTVHFLNSEVHYRVLCTVCCAVQNRMCHFET
jgi:hypothetical protein